MNFKQKKNPCHTWWKDAIISGSVDNMIFDVLIFSWNSAYSFKEQLEQQQQRLGSG